MNIANYQQCKRCVMDTSDPEISFDSIGNCNHCSEFIEKRSLFNYRGAESDLLFKQEIARIKKEGQGKSYDAIIGLSGGIDSSYVAHLCQKAGLRLLAVHLDNGWNSEEAVQNIRNIARKLNIDYESFVLDWEEFRDLQVAFLKAAVPEADTPTDIAILAALHKVASNYGVKNIISGGNFATEGILPGAWHYNAKDLRYFNHIQKSFGTKQLKHFPKFGFLKEMYYKIFRGIKMTYLLNHVLFIKEEAISFLEKELDWKYYGGKHYESLYTGFIQSYYLFTKFGIDYRRATLSSQICTGETTRDEALLILETLPFSDDKVLAEKKYIAKKLGLTLEALELIFASPAHWYTDYPNDKKRLNFIYNSYRKIFKKEKLASF